MSVCVCLCVLVGFGWRGQVHCDPGPLIYQRPHLSDMSSTFLLSLVGEKGSSPPPPPVPKNAPFFGRSLMLMSRPGLGLRAVNTELMRLVVCLCTVVTHLKDGPHVPSNWGASRPPPRVPSQALTQQRPCPRGFSPVSTPLLSNCTSPSQPIIYPGNFIMLGKKKAHTQALFS